MKFCLIDDIEVVTERVSEGGEENYWSKRDFTARFIYDDSKVRFPQSKSMRIRGDSHRVNSLYLQGVAMTGRCDTE